MKNRFSNSSLFVKICIITYSLMIIFGVVLLLAPYLLYQEGNSKRLAVQSQINADNAAEFLNLNYNNIMRNFVGVYGTEGFSACVRDIKNTVPSHYAVREKLHDYLDRFSNSSYLIDSVLIIMDYDGAAYSLYDKPLKPGSVPLTDEEKENAAGITWLSARMSPFRKSSYSVPIVFPLVLANSNYVTISRDPANVDLYVVVYVNYAALNDAMKISTGRNENSAFALVNENGGIICSSPELEDSDVSTITGTLWNGLSDGDGLRTSIHNKNYSAYLVKMDKCNVYLAYRIASTPFFESLGISPSILIYFFIFILLVLAAISYLMSHYVSKPVGKLVDVVHKIEDNEYDKIVPFETKDEIGKLGSAVNSMHRTIQAQMERIKNDEAEKYMAQIKLMTEQVNPHFLYNTLDSIQTLVKTGDRDDAASMIQNLANYLRIGLSYGDDLISLDKEIKHAHAYVQLMSQRFQQPIIFMYQLPHELEAHPILKTILQPLLENSIRHGFGIDATGMPILAPTIEINVSTIDESKCDTDGSIGDEAGNSRRLKIEIADNGSGFDVQKTLSVMENGIENSDASRHVGMHNVYFRLITYYGKDNVTIDLNSIPYYRNSITITIPRQ